MKLSSFALVLLATPAMADDVTIYQSPSGSTYSYIYRDHQPDWGSYAQGRAAQDHADEQALQRQIHEDQQRDRESWQRFEENQQRMESERSLSQERSKASCSSLYPC